MTLDIKGIKQLAIPEAHGMKTTHDMHIVGTLAEVIVMHRTNQCFMNIYFCGDKPSDGITIPLEYQHMRFGGKRWYFQCPIQKKDGDSCLKRATKLYFNYGRFGCRDCQHVTYESQVQKKKTRPVQYLEQYQKLKEEAEALPRKYYRNKPTKRYAQVQKKLERLANSPNVAYELELAGETEYMHSTFNNRAYQELSK